MSRGFYGSVYHLYLLKDVKALHSKKYDTTEKVESEKRRRETRLLDLRSKRGTKMDMSDGSIKRKLNDSESSSSEHEEDKLVPVPKKKKEDSKRITPHISK